MFAAVTGFAQDKLFETSAKPTARKGFIITGSASYDMPGGDLAKRFGTSYRVGLGLLHKSKNNWLYGFKYDFITGGDVHEDSLMINIKDKYSGTNNGKYVEFVNTDGTRIAIPIYERGFSISADFGKIFNTTKMRPDNGIMEITSAGYMVHYVNIYSTNGDVPEIRGNYGNGYDRLTSGFFLEQYLGYVYFSKSRLINFHVGIDALLGITQGRRGYQYDLMRSDNAQRTDILFGFKGGWYFPMFKRKSEDLLFE